MAVMLGSAPAVPVSSEETLIVAARDGDDRALEELYSRYRDRISAYIRRRISDHGRAEDVAQEVFISALRRLRTTDQPIVFKPWIYEIAKNACIDEHRRVVRNREVPLDPEAGVAGGQRPLLSLAQTPPAVLESKQQIQDLRGAFGGLSDHHHRLLVMRELEGLSYDEIGARMGMSRQMVESALFRARRKLGAEYAELSSGRRCQQVQAAIDSGRVLAYGSMGIRERRQLARHLAHCQLCRVSARLAGADENFVQPGRLGTKTAAILPFPAWGWWRGAWSGTAVRSGAGTPVAEAVGTASQSGISAAFTGAAVAIATLAIAAGGGPPGAMAQHAGPRARPRAAPSSYPPATGQGASPRHAGATVVVAPAAPRRTRERRGSAISRRSRGLSAPGSTPGGAAPAPSAAAGAGGSDSPSVLPARPAAVSAPATPVTAPALPSVTGTVTSQSSSVSQVLAGSGHASVPSLHPAHALPPASGPGGAPDARGLVRGNSPLPAPPATTG